MKTISVAFVAALSLAVVAGCKKKEGEASGASCDAVVAKMMTMQGAEMFGQLPPDKQEKWKKQFSDALVASCKEDKWAPEVNKCVADAKDAKAVDDCGKAFPKEQQEKMMKRLDPLMQGIMEDMGVGKPPGGAPSPEGTAPPPPPGEGAAPAPAPAEGAAAGSAAAPAGAAPAPAPAGGAAAGSAAPAPAGDKPAAPAPH